MVIPPLSLRARRRFDAVLRAATSAYRWLDTPNGGTVVTRAAVAGLSVIGAYVALRVYPDELPALTRHPDYLATVFQSRPIVFIGRVAILSVAAFAVFSIVARMWNRQWLAKAGPFEIERVATAVERENATLKKDLNHAWTLIRELRGDAGAPSRHQAPTFSIPFDDRGAADGDPDG